MPKAYLYNKHRPVLTVDIENGNIVRCLEVIDREFLPIVLQYHRDLESLNKWLSSRKIPEKREGLEDARMCMKADIFENYQRMFSLSDQYWFSFDGKDVWDKMNFFTNPYETVHGDLFFMPWKADIKRAARVETPDLTTNGLLMKCWVREEDGISYLYKAGSVKFKQEPLSEVMASIMIRKMHILPSVDYELTVRGLTMCSKCRNFVTENTEFVPAAHVYTIEKRERLSEHTILDHFIEMCEKLGIKGAKSYCMKMIGIDRVIGNHDRHLGNFGFIRSADTGEIQGFAPLFDFGTAYWANAYTKKAIESRLFGDLEDAGFKYIRKMIDVEMLMDTDQLIKLTNNYPGISKRQKIAIQERIENITEDIIQLSGGKKAREEKKFAETR